MVQCLDQTVRKSRARGSAFSYDISRNLNGFQEPTVEVHGDVCTICNTLVHHDKPILECDRCVRHGKIYGRRWPVRKIRIKLRGKAGKVSPIDCFLIE